MVFNFLRRKPAKIVSNRPPRHSTPVLKEWLAFRMKKLSSKVPTLERLFELRRSGLILDWKVNKTFIKKRVRFILDDLSEKDYASVELGSSLPEKLLPLAEGEVVCGAKVVVAEPRLSIEHAPAHKKRFVVLLVDKPKAK